MTLPSPDPLSLATLRRAGDDLVTISARFCTGPGQVSGRGRSPPGLVRSVATTVAGGYLVFLLVVLIFHVWVAGEQGALLSAVRGGAPLTAVAVAAFVLLSWLESRARP